MLLPFVGWALTGAVFFIKPGYAGAYELLAVRTYPLDDNMPVRIQAWRERYDIVLTDETMPDMTGTDLAREIRRLRADIPSSP